MDDDQRFRQDGSVKNLVLWYIPQAALLIVGASPALPRDAGPFEFVLKRFEDCSVLAFAEHELSVPATADPERAFLRCNTEEHAVYAYIATEVPQRLRTDARGLHLKRKLEIKQDFLMWAKRMQAQ